MRVVANGIGMASPAGRAPETDTREAGNPMVTMTDMALMDIDNPAGCWDTEYGLLFLQFQGGNGHGCK